jgi:SAM-dependent methyltransferase
MNPSTHKHWYPAANPTQQPSPWWYFGRAVYVSRRDYWRIFRAFVTIGVPLGAIGLLFPPLLTLAFMLAWLGLALLLYSLFGLYRMYGHPAAGYLRQLLALGDVRGPVAVADLHIGTYRHSYLLAQLLPEATVRSVDCWNVDGPAAEEAVQDVRAIEPAPQGHPRIQPLRAQSFTIPLPEASCDLVVFGFGTHELPAGGPREKLFAEAQRLLKPGGNVLLFEHGYDVHNYVIFGPVIDHVTRRDDWRSLLEATFADVRYARASQAVDLFVGTRRAV